MDVTMPQLGETVTEGTITRWLKQVGDQVAADEPLFEVSTDKVDSEVPAPAAGVLTEIRVQEGATADVGTILAVIGDGAEAPAAAPAAPAPAPAAAPEPVAPPAAEPPPAPVAPPSAPVAPPPAPVAPPSAPVAPPPQPVPPPAPVAPPPAPVAPPPAPVAPPTPPPAPVAPPAPPPAPAPAPVAAAAAGAAAGAALTSPVVRRLIAQHGLDPASITGTGEGGRITRKDVLDVVGPTRPAPPTPPTPPTPPPPAQPPVAAPPEPEPEPVPEPVPEPPAVVAPPPPPAPAPPVVAPPPPPAAAPPPAAPPAPAPPPAAPPPAPMPVAGNDRVVPFTNIRRRTAEHMVRSKATSAHVYTSVEVDFERIVRVRDAAKEAWREREGYSLTYLPFVARAFCSTVNQFPHVNASVVDETLVVHRDVHLAIAVDLEFEGLVAPVVRDADGKRLRLIAREIRGLAERARSKQLTPDEVLGGTFTITNPGPYGTFLTLPIINQPQVAILSTDGITKRPRVVGGADGEDVISVRHVGILSLAWDHRAFDGAYAAAFLNSLKEHLEQHDWAAELE